MKILNFTALFSFTLFISIFSACGNNDSSNITINGNGSIQGKNYSYLDIINSSKNNNENITLNHLHYLHNIDIFSVKQNSKLTNNGNLLIENSQTESLNAIDSNSSKTLSDLIIINDKNITIKNSHAKKSLNIIKTHYNEEITNNGNLTIANSTLDLSYDSDFRKKSLEIINMTGGVYFLNKGNLYIKDTNNTVGVYFHNSLGEFYNAGSIRIDSASHNSCAIKTIFSTQQNIQYYIKNIGTIIVGNKIYTDLTKAWNAPADANGNKPICHS